MSKPGVSLRANPGDRLVCSSSCGNDPSRPISCWSPAKGRSSITKPRLLGLILVYFSISYWNGSVEQPQNQSFSNHFNKPITTTTSSFEVRLGGCSSLCRSERRYQPFYCGTPNDDHQTFAVPAINYPILRRLIRRFSTLQPLCSYTLRCKSIMGI